MAQLNELASELTDEVQHHRDAIRKRNQVKFVKAGESSTVSKDCSSESGLANRGVNFVKAGSSGGAMASSSNSVMRFVKSSEDYQSMKRSAPPPMPPPQNRPTTPRHGATKRHHQQTIQDFLILEHKHKSDSVNAMSILNESAGFNHVDLDFLFREGSSEGAGRLHCHLPGFSLWGICCGGHCGREETGKDGGLRQSSEQPETDQLHNPDQAVG